MGYNTTVLILNDSLHVLEKNPDEFFSGLTAKMHEGGDISVRGHINPAYVMPTAHADQFRLYCTHANSILELSQYNKETQDLVDGKDYQLGMVKASLNAARRQLDSLEEYINQIERDKLNTK